MDIDPSLSDSLTTAALDDRAAVLFAYMRRRGQSHYDEAVTQLQHALQAAHQARSAGASAADITAALLHDIGHFVMDEEGGFQDEDWLHEQAGADLLAAFLPLEVTEPIRLHVPAKRYLCSVDPTYYDGLSAASQSSLRLQGGLFSDDERRAFESLPHFDSAIALRRWDDGAKRPDWAVPELESYRDEVAACFYAARPATG